MDRNESKLSCEIIVVWKSRVVKIDDDGIQITSRDGFQVEVFFLCEPFVYVVDEEVLACAGVLVADFFEGIDDIILN